MLCPLEEGTVELKGDSGGGERGEGEEELQGMWTLAILCRGIALAKNRGWEENQSKVVGVIIEVHVYFKHYLWIYAVCVGTLYRTKESCRGRGPSGVTWGGSSSVPSEAPPTRGPTLMQGAGLRGVMV